MLFLVSLCKGRFFSQRYNSETERKSNHIYLGNSILKWFLGSLDEFQQGSFTAQNINDI